MKTTVTDEPDVVGVDFKRWHKLVVDAAPKRLQTNEATWKTVYIEESIGCQLNIPVYVMEKFIMLNILNDLM